MDLKKCTRCGEEKLATTEFFYHRAKGVVGFKARCKACCKVAVSRWVAANAGRMQELRARWGKAHPDRIRAARVRHRKSHSARLRVQETETHRRRQYGLLPEMYDSMLNEQRGLCAVCQQPEALGGRGGAVMPLSVDHNHGTGVVRGLLCSLCNRAIGLLRDNPGIAEAAAAYRRHHATV
jgi:hypothetical protein